MHELLFLSLCFVVVVDSARILIFVPATSPSNMMQAAGVADVLAERGHDVLLYVPDYRWANTLMSCIHVHDHALATVFKTFIILIF
jgi:hypothetical protein